MRIDSETSVGPSLDYVERVNRAIDYILHNLTQPLRLETIARVAGFSQFHFHRIFQSLLDETLGQFVKRVRLERALKNLSHDPERSLIEVSLDCAFASPSDFSRSFKQRYGVPPSAFDVETFRTRRRHDWQDALADPELRHLYNRLPVGENPDGFEPRVCSLPARSVAYVRVLDPFRPRVVANAAKRLIDWAEAHGLAGGQWLGYMWDDPEIVANADCRYDVGLEVESVEPEGEVGRIDFPDMHVVQLDVRGPIDLELRAIDWLFRSWLPTSRYLPSEHPIFEAWNGRPFEHGLEHFELRIQVPIERG